MQVYDYIIVGAGSAGCVVANRLSADPGTTVLLLEAGGESNSIYVKMPKGFYKITGDPKLTWTFHTEAQLHRGRDPEIWPRGKMLGGTSTINGMIYSRGQQQDYEEWEQLGNGEFGWPEILRCFRALEDHSLGANDWRGEGGPLPVTAGHFRYPLAEKLIQAGQEMGLARVEDFNGPSPEGVGYYAQNIRSGRRVTAAVAFLDPIRHRKNLTIVTYAQVDRILFDADLNATGVEARTRGGKVTFEARREVILSAGTFHSPKLLQLSGIGDGALLAGLGVPVKRHSPAVGRHMRDHLGMWVNYRLKGGERGHNRLLRGLGLWGSVLRYGLARNGILSTGPMEVGAFARSGPEVDRPNLQLFFVPVSLEPIRPGSGYAGGVEKLPGLTVNCSLLRPTSEGHVAIRSPDPDVQIGIHPNWLATPEDRKQAIDMIKYTRAFLARPAVAPYIGEETVPGRRFERDEQIAEALDRGARTCNHATGTCRMGREDSVVDGRLRVRGVRRVRVADCSVMPTMPSGNTNAPAMALAWRASELILEDSN